MPLGDAGPEAAGTAGSGGDLAQAAVQVDPARQARAREYAARRRRLYLADLGLGALYCAGALASGAAVALRDLARTALAPPGVPAGVAPLAVVALFLVVFWAGYTALTLPLAAYAGFVLPRRYGLSVQSFGAWLLDWAKAGLLSLAFLLLLTEATYLLLAVLPDLWWLLVGAIYLLLTVVLAHLAPVLLLPLFYRLTPLPPESPLARRLAALAERAGARVRGVYSLDLSRRTTAANAALLGLGSTRSIVLGDTLLERFTPDEVEVVFAHELGHHVHRDVPKLVLAQAALALVGLRLVDLGLRWLAPALGLSSPADVAALPLLALALGAFGVVTLPLGNAVSRHLEGAADRYALAVTGQLDAFVRAMVKLADQNLAEYAPPRWVELLLYSHPALSRRVERARALAAGRPPVS